MLIDEFSVNGEVETFNYGVENSIFTVLVSGAVTDSEIGEGYAEGPLEELGEVALKILFNNSDDGVRARTANAYAGGSAVSFKYFIQADTSVQWTRFIWDTDTSCYNYEDTYTSFGNTEWRIFRFPSGPSWH